MGPVLRLAMPLQKVKIISKRDFASGSARIRTDMTILGERRYTLGRVAVTPRITKGIVPSSGWRRWPRQHRITESQSMSQQG